MDFVSDSLATGRRFRTLNIADDFNRRLTLASVNARSPGVTLRRPLGLLQPSREQQEALRLSVTEAALDMRNLSRAGYFRGLKAEQDVPTQPSWPPV
jgi:hypothetical protein